MSASNWAICPFCVARAHEELNKLATAVHEGYGVLPVDEFEVLRSELAKGIDEEKLRTFREDYEFYGATKGTVTASYSGGCNVCGAHLDFEVVQQVLAGAA